MSKVPLYPLSPHQGALVSQDYRVLFEQSLFGIPYSSDVECTIQPSSLDTLTEGRCYWLKPGFRHEPGLPVMESVRLSHRRFPKEISIPSSGLLCEKDFTFLVPLKGQWFIPDGYSLISSPKSTQGRLGNRVRLIADGQPCYDLVKGPWKGRLFVLFEPQCWSNILYENISLNQLRLMCGSDNQVSDGELSRRWDKEGFLQRASGGAIPLAENPYMIHNGVLMRLDLEGLHTNGIVAFQALPNPMPIDQKKIDEGGQLWKEYFKPIMAPEDGVLSSSSELLILNTLDVHVVPLDLCAQMTPYSEEVGDIKLHEAGFFDSGFSGRGVKEVWKKERLPHSFRHRQNAGRLVYFRNRSIPDKGYGKGIGSHYAGQVGPRLAKQFGELTVNTYREIREDFDKDSEPILVLPRSELFGDAALQGFDRGVDVSRLEQIMNAHAEFKRRGDVEVNPDLKQPIPYVVCLCQSTREVFCYQRSSSPDMFRERRLYGKWSVGVGGHVRRRDGAPGMEAVGNARIRELQEEVAIPLEVQVRFAGLLNDDRDAVGRVHVGLVYMAHVSEEQKNAIGPRAREVRAGRWVPVGDLVESLTSRTMEFEGWTEIMIWALEEGLLW